VILTIVFAYFTYANTVYFSLVLTSFADA
jgi:hypothetical protein